MGVFYPQCAVTLRVRWEDFGDKAERFQKVWTMNILARRVRVNINDYLQADSFDMEVDFRNFPFDPRTIRAVGVTIHMQDMRKLVDESGKEVQIRPTRDNAIFIGFADEEGITFDESKRTVKLEGRDFTGLLIDQKYLGPPIDLEQTIEQLFFNLLSDLPAAADILVTNRVGEPLPVLAKFMPDKEEGSGKKNPKRQESYWDVIQDVVARAGLIAYIELDRLIITRPRVLYNREKSKIFIYGLNVSNFEMKRKIGRKKNFNVVVRSLNLETKEVLEAKIPAEATDEWSKETGITNEEVRLTEIGTDGQPVPPDKQKPAPYQSFRVANINNKEQLVKIGEGIYEEIGRQQLEGSFQTKDMYVAEADPSALTSIPDEDKIKIFKVLEIRIGTPVLLEVDQSDIRQLARFTRLEEKSKYLVDRGYDKNLADLIATNIKRLDTVFYTKAVEFQFDENGFRCKIDFLNFIEVGNLAKNG